VCHQRAAWRDSPLTCSLAIGPRGGHVQLLRSFLLARSTCCKAVLATGHGPRAQPQTPPTRLVQRHPCAVVSNRGWDSNAILGHVDPHSVTESACAGSHTQISPTNLCGSYFWSSEVGCLYTARSVSTRGRALRRIWPPKWTGSALYKAMWNSRSVRPQRHVEATAALWAACWV